MQSLMLVRLRLGVPPVAKTTYRNDHRPIVCDDTSICSMDVPMKLARRPSRPLTSVALGTVVALLAALALTACGRSTTPSSVSQSLRSSYCAHVEKWWSATAFDFQRDVQEQAAAMRAAELLVRADGARFEKAGYGSTAVAVGDVAAAMGVLRTEVVRRHVATYSSLLAYRDVTYALGQVPVRCPCPPGEFGPRSWCTFAAHGATPTPPPRAP